MPTEIAAVDVEAVQALLLAVEREDHRHGWDNPNCNPGLFLLHHAHARTEAMGRALRRYGRPVTCGGYVATPLAPRFDLPIDPTVVLFRFARRFAADTSLANAMLRHICQPGLIGAGFVAEAWQLRATPEQIAQIQAEQAADPRKSLADRVGSVEIRQAAAVDVAGRGYRAVRVRGEQPAAYTGPILKHGEAVPDGFFAASGAGFDALTLIVARVAGQPLPEPTHVPVAWPCHDGTHPDA
jgi:hypothetical protein